MVEIYNFRGMFEYLKNIDKVTSLKDFSEKSGYNYTYLSELNNEKKPLTKEFVRTISVRLEVDFKYLEIPLKPPKYIDIPKGYKFDLKLFMNDKELRQKDLAILLDKPIDEVSDVVKGKIKLPNEWISYFKDRYSLSDIDYIEEIYDSEINSTQITPKYIEELQVKTDIRLRNVPLINRYAYASYIEHYNDQEFLDSMEQIPTMQDEDGNYIWVEVHGDSMQRSEAPSIDPKDHILCRELYRHHWNSLQLKRQKVWVISHKEKGLLIKEIVKQDGPILTCRSWNPHVSEFVIHLDDILQLFYVKEQRKKY